MEANYINRDLTQTIQRLFEVFESVTLTGPRQSGKTTLCRTLFQQLPYVNLEDQITLAKLKNNPRDFLAQFEHGCIIDEAQRAPEVFSYVQLIIDEDRFTDRHEHKFILSGSNNLSLIHNITQSLAGRTAILNLLPLSCNELTAHGINFTTNQLLLNGGYPAVWLSGEQYRSVILDNYYTTYVERDVRNLVSVTNMLQFNNFVRLCAGRVGTEFNASSLAVEVGVSVNTIKSWLSILTASYIVFTLQPFYANINKRLVKKPKIYFYDTGLAAHLMGINTQEQLAVHPLRGSLFENMVVTEFMKKAANNGTHDSMYFYRDRTREVDLLQVSNDGKIKAFEIKSATRYNTDFVSNLNYLKKFMGENIVSSTVIYDGPEEPISSQHKLINYRNL